VEPPVPPTSGQPLYNGHWLWHQFGNYYKTSA